MFLESLPVVDSIRFIIYLFVRVINEHFITKSLYLEELIMYIACKGIRKKGGR